jgi:hypothetical protein
MEEIPYVEADSRSASQEIHSFNPKVHYSVDHSSLIAIPNLSHMNTPHGMGNRNTLVPKIRL